MMDKPGEIKQKCGAYFRGKDGRGTCSNDCQWYVKGSLCPNSVEAKNKYPTLKDLQNFTHSIPKTRENK